mgnify:CR=1 FL=1
MPIYAYTCKNCEHQLDALQKISDDPLVDCPECGQPDLKRLLSAPRFRLKGSGWYETDFKTDNKRNLAASDNEKPKADTKTGGDKPADTKTTDKKPAKQAASPDK